MQYSDLEKAVKIGAVDTLDIRLWEEKQCYNHNCKVKKPRIVSLWAFSSRNKITWIRSLHQHCINDFRSRRDNVEKLDDKDIFTLKSLCNSKT